VLYIYILGYIGSCPTSKKQEKTYILLNNSFLLMKSAKKFIKICKKSEIGAGTGADMSRRVLYIYILGYIGSCPTSKKQEKTYILLKNSFFNRVISQKNL
jgi:hypothetical protein